MYPYADAQATLELHQQRADDLRREAAAYRLARATSPAGRHRRFGRADRRPQAVGAPATP
jgi:hypothetical protein